MKSFSNLQKQNRPLTEEDQINICKLNRLVASCKKCRDSAKQEEYIYGTLPLFNEVEYTLFMLTCRRLSIPIHCKTFSNSSLMSICFVRSCRVSS